MNEMEVTLRELENLEKTMNLPDRLDAVGEMLIQNRLMMVEESRNVKLHHVDTILHHEAMLIRRDIFSGKMLNYAKVIHKKL